MNYNEAKQKAIRYFSENFGVDTILSALENEKEWLFTYGIPGEANVGVSTIAISKADGHIESIQMPSLDGIKRINSAHEVTEETN